MPSDIHEAPYWLALFSASDLARAAAKRAVFEWCVEQANPLSSLFALADPGLAELGLGVQQAGQLRETALRVEEQRLIWQSLVSRGFGLLSRDDIAFPDGLAQRLPESWVPYFVVYRGDLQLLSEPGLCFHGSSQPSESARVMLAGMSTGLADESSVLLSVLDKGVDALSLGRFLRASGRAIVMLACGVEQCKPDLEPFESAVDEGRLLVLSPYAPDAQQSSRLALASRALVGAMAEAVMLVEPDAGPSAWPSIPEEVTIACKSLVWTGDESDSAQAWIEAGATFVADASQALRELGRVLGKTDDGATSAASVHATADTEADYHVDTASTMELLQRMGRVPHSLAKRIGESAEPPRIAEEEAES